MRGKGRRLHGENARKRSISGRNAKKYGIYDHRKTARRESLRTAVLHFPIDRARLTRASHKNHTGG
jgi:hypothetical protein